MGDKCIIVKTLLDNEKTVASRIKELIPYLDADPLPEGFKGLVLVEGCKKPDEELKLLLENIPEIERGYKVLGTSTASLEDIVETVTRIAAPVIDSGKCFAVRTVRRGRHEFTSIDVNVAVGAALKEETGACVDLEYPDVVVGVEIIKDKAYITLYPGSSILHKYGKNKKMLHKLMGKISVVQMPYIAEPEVSYKMGVRVGREVQNFEVKELVIAPIGVVEAYPLARFIEGVMEGINSRFTIQKKTYSRKPHRVNVRIADLYQLVRSRRNEPIIVLEPEGDYVSGQAEKLALITRRGKRINLLAGSREGIPLGVYRIADTVVDIAPGITLSTEFAVAAGLIAIATAIYDLVEP